MTGIATLTHHTSQGKPVYSFDPPFQGFVPMAIVSTVTDEEGTETALFPTDNGEQASYAMGTKLFAMVGGIPRAETNDVGGFLFDLGYEVAGE